MNFFFQPLFGKRSIFWGKKSKPRTLCLQAALFLLLVTGLQGGKIVAAKAEGLPHQVPLTLSHKKPVVFVADRIIYDKAGHSVIAEGHVEAWQNGQSVLADKFVYNTQTGILTASGHVVLIERNGQKAFASKVILSDQFKNAFLSSVYAKPGDNITLAAVRADHIPGVENRLTRAVYTACDVCEVQEGKIIPTTPFWQINAGEALQNLQDHKVEFWNAFLEFKGIPVFWTPYLSAPGPSVKRSSGFLLPAVGSSSKSGIFIEVPYFWAINGHQDLTVVPIVTTKLAPALDLTYRQAFNKGFLSVKGTTAYLNNRPEQAIFAKGTFNYNPVWRYGFDINRATSRNLFINYILPSDSYLVSNVYTEAFWPHSYFYLTAQAYQGLSYSIINSDLPIAMPYATYSYLSEPVIFGGRISFNSSIFNIVRNVGTNTRRLAATLDWKRLFIDRTGGLWNLDLHLTGAFYSANDLNKVPNYLPADTVTAATWLPELGVKWSYPLIRVAKTLGVQEITPIVQVILAPQSMWNIGNAAYIPNEDSLSDEFTTDTLFSLNRLGGEDRQETGPRVNVGLKGNWFWHGRDFLRLTVGQSYRLNQDSEALPGSGLQDEVSDFVVGAGFSPLARISVNYLGRFSHENGADRYSQVMMNFSGHHFNFGLGYLFTATDPYFLYDQSYIPAGFYQPRSEVMLNFNAQFHKYSFAVSTQNNIETGELDNITTSVGYQNGCFGTDLIFYRSNTSLIGQQAQTTVLLQMTLKTVGQFTASML